MNRFFFPVAVLCLSTLLVINSETARALEIAGVDLPEKIAALDGRSELILNGASLRKAYYFADVYIGSLYLEKPETSPNAIFESDGYKRMSFYLLRDVRGRRIATALKDAMQVNLTAEEIEGFTAELEQLMNLLDRKVSEGEEGVVEYVPGKGSRIVIANAERGTIPGKAFFNAVLSAWIGEQPVSNLMKQQLLGAEDTKKRTAVRSKNDDF